MTDEELEEMAIAFIEGDEDGPRVTNSDRSIYDFKAGYRACEAASLIDRRNR